LENLPGGVLEQQVDGGLVMNSGTGQFHNRGVWRRSGGGGVAYLGPGLVFTNAGSVLVETGALEFTYGLTSSGAFVVSNGASLRFNGGTFNALVGHGIEGPGYYGVPSGSVVWNGPVAEPDFRFDGGSLTLTGALSGAISWYSGTLGGSWVIRPGGSLNIVSNSGGWYLGGILTNQGQVVWRTGSSGTFYWMGGARLENEGVLDLQVNGTLQSLSGAGVLNNSGQITKSDGIGTTTVLSSINLTNSGTIQVHKGILSLPVSCVSSGGEFSVDIRETNDYGRITSGGGLDLPSRVELVVKEGYRPPIGALFNVVGFTGYQGQLFEFSGIDLGDGLRLAPSLLPSGLTFQAVAYDTNQLHRLHMEGCGSGWLLWWPIALSGLELGTTSQLDVPTWTGVEAPYHNRVVTADTSVRFFRLGTGLVTRVNVPISP
jgi:hypothetical protein